MAATIDILGIRHHGPGSARMALRALEALAPEAVLIEGPPDAQDLITLAAHPAMKPPVALLVYEPEAPANAAYYPFAEFSPEWQAIRWSLAHKAEVRFIDLPWASRAPEKDEEGGAGAGKEEGEDQDEESNEAPQAAAAEPSARPSRVDLLETLAHAAGFEDGEAWWGRLIEERLRGDDAREVFAAILDAVSAVREGVAEAAKDEENAQREAHMRRAIRQAVKEGFSKIAVVCGAFHAPALTAEAIERAGAKADEQRLKGLPKRKTTATWIPWTFDRLSMWSGYGAGVNSPGWYEHLWNFPERHAAVERWMTRVARLMRSEDLDASPAHVIEASRLAHTLAALRGRSLAGLEELNEATLSVVCAANPLPLKLIERKLIVGVRMGQVPEDAPAVPLARDLAAQQKTLRMKVTGEELVLDLDQRKPIDLSRSRLLHRLNILRIDWGELTGGRGSARGTFHEIWKLRWRPELAVNVVDAARWGNTVFDAAEGRAADLARQSTNLAELTDLLDDVLLADLPSAVGPLIARIETVAALAIDVTHLMKALPPLAGVLRYGNVRSSDTALVEPVVVGLLARICAGLVPACGSLDDDAAAAMAGHINGVHGALATLDRADLRTPWRERLRALGDAKVHGRVAGRCWRILLDAQAATMDEAGRRVSLALSPGNNPADAAAWLEGFLAGSGLALVHDRALIGIIDAWVTGLTADVFEQVCPMVRRTFSTFEKPERRQIGEVIRRGTGDGVAADAGATSGEGAGAGAEETYNALRGERVVAVLKLLLGEPL